MEKETWELLMVQLQDIKKQNDDQLALLHQHLADDQRVKETVDRHSTYFKFAGTAAGFGVPTLLAYLATKLGIK